MEGSNSWPCSFSIFTDDVMVRARARETDNFLVTFSPSSLSQGRSISVQSMNKCHVDFTFYHLSRRLNFNRI